MKNLILLLALFSLQASAQENKLNATDKALFDGYKKEGDLAYANKKYSKAASQYQYAQQICHECIYLNSLIDSCNAHQQFKATATRTTSPTRQPLAIGQKNDDFKQAAEMGALAKHGQLTQFSDMKYNFVSSRIQKYISKYLNMFPDADDVNGDNVVLRFKEKSAINAPQKELIFTFGVNTVGSDFVIRDCKITGDKQKLIDFYLNYWNTKLKLDENKTGLVAETKLLADNSNLYLEGNKSYIEVKRTR
jgi:hypothetical protein